MITHVENLTSAGLVARLRSFARVVAGAAVLLGALGVPLHRLRSTEGRHHALVDAQARLNALSAEARDFSDAGGLDRLQELRRALRADLPQGLSRVDVRALVTLVAEASGFELETVAVGRFEEAPFPRLDDAIARAEVSLSGHASPQQLADLVELLTRLGYPTTVLDVRMHRSSTDAARFEQQVTLGLHQSIPVPASHTESGSGTEIPK